MVKRALDALNGHEQMSPEEKVSAGPLCKVRFQVKSQCSGIGVGVGVGVLHIRLLAVFFLCKEAYRHRLLSKLTPILHLHLRQMLTVGTLFGVIHLTLAFFLFIAPPSTSASAATSTTTSPPPSPPTSTRLRRLTNPLFLLSLIIFFTPLLFLHPTHSHTHTPFLPFSSSSSSSSLPYTALNGDLIILNSTQSITGRIVVADNLKDGYRFLRCDHSLLGGRWIMRGSVGGREGGELGEGEVVLGDS